MPARPTVARVLGLLLALVTLVPPLGAAPAAAHDRLAATIRTAEYGVPHVRGRTFADAGFGVGYAQARDALCVLADAYVTVDAERSRFFGPDGVYELGGSEANPTRTTNLASDLVFQRLIDTGEVDRLVAVPAPDGPRREVRDLVRGFVAGYNRRLADLGPDGITDPACRGAAWVRPITEATAWRYLYQVSLLASGTSLVNDIAAAQPPVPGAPTTPGAVPADAAARAAADLDLGVGSNGIAVGREGTANGRGLRCWSVRPGRRSS